MRSVQLTAAAIVAAAVLLPAPPTAGGEITGTVKVLGSKGLDHVVVYIENVVGQTYAPLHKDPVIDQVRMAFTPHVLPILVGTTVDFPNNDSTRHNVFSPSKAKRFNLGTYPAGITKRVTFDKVGVVALLCNVHPEMSAYIVALQNPYYAMPGKRGAYKIAEVPSGRYRLIAWHEKLKPKHRDIEVPQQGEIVADFSLDE